MMTGVIVVVYEAPPQGLEPRTSVPETDMLPITPQGNVVVRRHLQVFVTRASQQNRTADLFFTREMLYRLS